MEAILERDILIETYHDVEGLINSICHKFWSRFGGSFEDWKAEANLIYIESFNSHKKRKSCFATWLYINLQGKLFNHFKKENIQQIPINKNDEVIDEEGVRIPLINTLADKTNPFYFPIDLLDEIKTKDSKTLISLILDMPADLKQEELKLFPGLNDAYDNNPCHMKSFLQKYLRKIGWTGGRITASFQEIGEALYA